MFSRFDTIPACDGRTDGQTNRQTDRIGIAKTCFSIADARKKVGKDAVVLQWQWSIGSVLSSPFPRPLSRMWL